MPPGMHTWSSRSVVAAGLWLALAPQQTPRMASGLPPSVTLASGWLLQDIANVDAAADRISSVGFAPEIYVPHPYVAPATAIANPASEPGKNGDARPPHSSAWQQAP